MSDGNETTIRPATSNDLLACTAVWRSTVDPMLAPPTAAYPLYGHELETGTLLVAEQGDGVIGFGASITRGERWFLADLFVVPEHHSSGAGRMLLDALVETDGPGPIRAVMATHDPRAISLYTRLGMAPRWPCFSIVGLPHRTGHVMGAGRPMPVRCGQRDLLEAAEACEYPLDSRDLTYWQRTVGAEPVLVGDGGEPIGGAVVRWATPFSIAHPDSISVGPIFARSANDITDVASSVLEFVREQEPSRLVRLYVPGPNPSLGPLLQAGYRIEEFELHSSSEGHEPPFLDPMRVLPSHDLL